MKMKKFISSLGILGTITGMLFVSPTILAETALDPAPEVQPSQTVNNGKKILFDNTHGQTAGAADWVIDGAFSDFADALGEKGYYVKELRQLTPITLADLKDYDVFIIPEANIPYKASEQQAIEDYVSQGGAVFYIGDHYNADRNKNRIDSVEAFNGYRRGAYEDITKDMSTEEKNSDAMQGVTSSDWLSETFGIRFRFNSIDNIEDSQEWIVEDAFGITEGVSKVGLHAGATLAITDPTKAKGIVYTPNGLTKEKNKWRNAVDEGVYNGGGIEEGPYVAISKKDQGKAAFVGDSSLVEDITPKYTREENGATKRTYDGFKEGDDAQLLLQLVDWLDDTENYTDFSQTSVALSTKTPVLDFEVPENTTEPQAEPWAMPQVGYKWYDPSTFAAGSFGSSEDPVEQPSISVVYQNTPNIKEENKVTIEFSGLKPNAVSEGYQFGVYTPVAQNGFAQGNQVAATKVGDDAWQETLGYSNTFSVTADSSGKAKMDVRFKVQYSGDYNFRIRQNKTNMLTQSITVKEEADVVTPAPNEEDATYDVTGQISFITSDKPVNPLDPENPGNELDPVNPDGSKPGSGTGGLLSIDYASSFSFGKQVVENQLKNYGAFAQKYNNSDKFGSNYVQVTDKRGSGAGWVLSVLQNKQFSSSTAGELTGAKLFLGNGQLNSPNMLQAGFDESLKPTHFVSDLVADNSQVVGGLELIPGYSSVLMSADKNQGTGTWTLAYGHSKDSNIGQLTSNDPEKSSVILSVPSSANPKETTYDTVLTYKLSMVPAP